MKRGLFGAAALAAVALTVVLVSAASAAKPPGFVGDISAVIAGAGLSGGGTEGEVTLGLSSSGCVAGEVWTWTGSAWSCEAPAATKPGYYKTGASLPSVELTADSTEQTILALDLPAGSYAVTGTVVVLAQDIAPAPAAIVGCRIFGGTGAYAGSQLQITPTGQLTMPIIGGQTLSSAGQVRITCSANELNVPVPGTQKLVQVRANILAQAVDPLTSVEAVG